MTDIIPLPVCAIKVQILEHLERHKCLVLTAPTGSGKTTQVPQILLDANFGKGQIIVLQPRRLAARLVARWVAAERGESVGRTIGYQTRHDSQISDQTRICFMTEGLFLRKMQEEPFLSGVDAVILDEFHERNLDADIALGLVRRLQQQRPDLRLVVMSATLETHGLATALQCPVLEAHGRLFPVEIRYIPASQRMPIWEQAARVVKDIVASDSAGDILVFMPGTYEIYRTITTCQQRLGQIDELVFLPLHGALTPGQQDEAVAPYRQRKVIVATNIAETSITIAGIHHVVDSGLARQQRHDGRRGIDVLLITPISCAAAEQRAGRAGRTAPGTCTRLWSQIEQEARPTQDIPEIQRMDLAGAVLQLKAIGVEQIDSFPWLEPPQAAALGRAYALLTDLGGLNKTGQLTAIGEQLAALPMHPRLARMLVEAAQQHCLKRANLWAALIVERDILVRPVREEYRRPALTCSSDLVVRERAFLWAKEMNFESSTCMQFGINSQICQAVEQNAVLFDRAAKRVGLTNEGGGTDDALVKCLGVAFFDRVAWRRQETAPGCVMEGQRRVELDATSVVQEAGLLIALEARELEDRNAGTVKTVLSMASALKPEWLVELHPERINHGQVLRWNTRQRAVEIARTTAYNELEFAVQLSAAKPGEDTAAILVERIQDGEVHLTKWDQNVEAWIARTRFVASLFPERGLLCYEEDDIAVIIQEIVVGATRFSQVRDRPCLDYVKNALSWPDQTFIEKMAPVRFALPSGQTMKIDYPLQGGPRGKAKIQELYGLEDTPRIAGGRHTLLLEILGPNFRPVQVTDDLRGFWTRTYGEVKKELKRRYPKHEWR